MSCLIFFVPQLSWAIFFRPKWRLKWGYLRSIAPILLPKSNYIVRESGTLKSEAGLRSLKAAWEYVLGSFSMLIWLIFCMAGSLCNKFNQHLFEAKVRTDMLEVTSDHLWLTSNFCSLRIVEEGHWRLSFFWCSKLPQHQNIFMKTVVSKEPSTEIKQKISSLFTSWLFRWLQTAREMTKQSCSILRH